MSQAGRQDSPIERELVLNKNKLSLLNTYYVSNTVIYMYYFTMILWDKCYHYNYFEKLWYKKLSNLSNDLSPVVGGGEKNINLMWVNS